MTLRSTAALAAIFVFSSAAHAGVAEELIAAINKCAVLAEDGLRHSCYDRLPEKVKSLVPESPAAASATVATAPAPAAAAVSASPAAQPAAEKESDGFLFGLFGSSSSDSDAVDQITATIESYTFDYGLFVVTLDNGQVWRQVAAVGDILHFSREHKDKVTIWRRVTGEYVLKVDGYRARYHVRRVR